MEENANCTLCSISSTCNPKAVCLKGEGDRDAALCIFLDHPNFVEDRRGKGMVADHCDFIRWLFRRMSITRGYYMDYVLKCFPKNDKNASKKAYRANMLEECSVYRFATLQSIRPKAIVAMGKIACEAFTGSGEVGEYEGARWLPNEPRVREIVEAVWVTYSPAYPLHDGAAAESVAMYRTLYSAAEEAGLNPKFDSKVRPYDYGT